MILVHFHTVYYHGTAAMESVGALKHQIITHLDGDEEDVEDLEIFELCQITGGGDLFHLVKV